ncbi:MAG: glycosyltransferase family 4 protein [Polyangiaceae bacterium]
MRERIAVVTTSYPEGPGDPSGHFVETDVRALEARGADVEVFALRGEAFGWPGVASRLADKPWRVLGASRTMWRVHRAITHLGSFSRVIAHWALPCAWPIAAGVPNLEIVSHGGDVRLLAGLPHRMRDQALQLLLQNTRVWRFPSETLLADLLLLSSPEVAEKLRRIARVEAPPIDLDVDPKAIARARERQRSLANGAPAFVSAARLISSKRIDRAVDIAMRERAALFVIGDGPEREGLEAYARKRRAHAHFFGKMSRPETLAHIAAADAVVHTSEAEGLSSVIREAEALGVRVLSA